jgi:hypothetical protein
MHWIPKIVVSRAERKVALENWKRALPTAKTEAERDEIRGIIRNLERMLKS